MYEFESTDFADHQKREHMHRLLNNLGSLESFLNEAIESGEVTESLLEDLIREEESYERR